MQEYAELEIGLQRRWSEKYSLYLRFSHPTSAADVSFRDGEAEFDPTEFSVLDPSSPEYGEALAQCLFGEERVRAAFSSAFASARADDLPVRLRLLIDPSAAELHQLCWEALLDPESGALFSASETTPFSRYLTSLDWRPVRIRPQGELQALVALANPANLAEYRLDPLDAAAELGRTRDSLGGLLKTELAAPVAGERATLANLIDRLETGHNGRPYDVLYLLCHGAYVNDEPWLFLEDPDGQVARVSGADLAARIRELADRPVLIVLASCQSAGPETGAALRALGPRLIAAGIPAVLAMQGQISQESVAEFMPAFFKTLRRTGEVDRAVAVARGRIRERSDFWAPALFMRLRSGRIWYAPGLSSDQDEIDVWQSLKTFIRVGKCTAILGPELVEPLLGSRQEIALRWADEHGYPLSPFDREDLPRVAQYIVTRQGPEYLSIIYREALKLAVQRRYPEALSTELRKTGEWTDAQLQQALLQAAAAYWSQAPANTYQLLAQLRLPVYITANPSDLLANALRQAGAEPEVRLCLWNEDIPEEKCLYEGDPDGDHPLIYHLFGHLSEPASLVLTEDQFFDFLIGIMEYKDYIPGVISTKITNSALLFLGFQLEDWYFRAFFRLVKAKHGARGWRNSATPSRKSSPRRAVF